MKRHSAISVLLAAELAQNKIRKIPIINCLDLQMMNLKCFQDLVNYARIMFFQMIFNVLVTQLSVRVR